MCTVVPPLCNKKVLHQLHILETMIADAGQKCAVEQLSSQKQKNDSLQSVAI